MVDLPIRDAVASIACVSPRIRTDGRIGAVLLEDGIGTIVAFENGETHTVREGVGSAREDSGVVFDWDALGLVWVDTRGALCSGPAQPDGKPQLLWDGGRAHSPMISPDGVWVAFVGETATSCEILIAPRNGERDAIAVSTGAFAWDPAWSPRNDVAWQESDLGSMPWEQSRIMLARKRPAAAWDQPRLVGPAGGWVAQPRFNTFGRLAALHERDGWLNLRLFPTGDDPSAAPPAATIGGGVAEPREHGEPNWSSGQRSWAWTTAGGVVLNSHCDGWSQLEHRVDLEGSEASIWSRGWHTQLDHRDGVTVALRSGARTPQQLARYDADGLSTVLWQARARHEEDREPSQVKWNAGTELRSGLLWHPPALREVRGLIVQCHGGPTGASNVTYKNNPRFWTSRGWAVFQPNPAGSSGGGARLRSALAGTWGQRDVDEVLVGLRHVAGTIGGGDLPIVTMGSSAGGMLALLLADHWAGRISAALVRCPVTDPRMLDATSGRFEQGYAVRMAGPRPPQSAIPIETVGVSRTPVFIAHGTADSVVPIDQSRAYAARARAVGRTVELMECEGEGHSFATAIHKIAELERSLEFLYRFAADRPSLP